MNVRAGRRHAGAQKRRGYSLIELVVSMASAATILGGLSASIYIASQAIDDNGGPSVHRLEADEILDHVLADVKLALSFSERTPSAVTFTVPDRSGDGRPETIRYAWSGTPGDPLTYAYNGSAAELIATDVHDFKLAALTRFMTASVIPPSEGGSKLLLVVADPAVPTLEETARQSLIESWGYTVTLIDDGDTQANFDAAAAENDVAYICADVNDAALDLKLRDAAVGVVNEDHKLCQEMGMSVDSLTALLTAIEVTDATHYITSPFSIGSLTITSQSYDGVHLLSPLASGIESLAEDASAPVISVLPAGATMYGGGNVAGRRVQLPWGNSNFELDTLNDNGRTLMQRSIEWAAGAGSAGGGPLLLVVSDSASPSTQEIARQTLMESWDYTVTLLDDDTTTLELATAMSLNDVIYISQEITNLTVLGKLRDTTLGVVNEEYLMSNVLGFGTGTGTGFFNDINVVDNTHYITSVFSSGPLALFDPTYDIYTGTGFTLAPGADVLGQTGSITGLMALETGATLHDGGNAVGRRVLVPWGDDFAALNPDGQTLMQRAIEWAAVPSPTPIGHWKLDDATGLTATDSSGRGNDGTLTGGPDWTDGLLAGALALDDFSNDRVVVPDDPSLDITDAITLAAWIKPNGLGSQFIISKSVFDVIDGYELSLSNVGKVFFRLNQQSSANTWRVQSTSIHPTDGTTWMHIAATYDGETQRLYINGVEENSQPASIAIATNDIDLGLGGQADGTRVIDGVIDDVRLYDRALSPAEISELFASAGGPAPDGNFGFETQFASTFNSGNGVQVGTQVSLIEDGTLNSITAYIDPGGGGKNYRFAIYDDNGGEPGDLIVESAIDDQSGTGWKTINVTPTPLTAGTYWLALAFSHGSQQYYYESTGGNTRHKLHSAVQNGFISVWPGSTTPYPYKISIYGTYTPSN